MKCELCQKNDAEAAVVREENGEEQELYVCHACAAEIRKAKQKRSQRTRKMPGLPPGMSVSITGVSEDGNPPPFLGAILDAVHGMVSDIEKAEGERRSRREPDYHILPTGRVEAPYRVGERLHLEGIHLIGELEAVKRAMGALGAKLVGVDADGVKGAGHVYSFHYSGASEQAKRIVGDLLAQERNARVRLFEDLPRVFGDSLCRALAILKNCRLLSSGELFDLLSPLRLAALENMLDGMTLRSVEARMAECDLSGSEDKLEQEERDRVDAERAEATNRAFEDVVLNERAEEKFL